MSSNLIQDISTIVPCICVKETKITIYPPEINGLIYLKPGSLVEILELNAIFSSDKNKRICKLYDEILEEFDKEELYLCSKEAFEPINDNRLMDVIKGMRELNPRFILFENKIEFSALNLHKSFHLNFIDTAELITIPGELTFFGKKPDIGSGYYLGFDVEVS